MRYITLFLVLFSLMALTSAQLSYSNPTIPIITSPTSITTSAAPASGANVTSVTSSTNCILVNPTTGNVVITFNTSCGNSTSSTSGNFFFANFSDSFGKNFTIAFASNFSSAFASNFTTAFNTNLTAVLPLANRTLVHCSNITGSLGNLCINQTQNINLSAYFQRQGDTMLGAQQINFEPIFNSEALRFYQTTTNESIAYLGIGENGFFGLYNTANGALGKNIFIGTTNLSSGLNIDDSMGVTIIDDNMISIIIGENVVSSITSNSFVISSLNVTGAFRINATYFEGDGSRLYNLTIPNNTLAVNRTRCWYDDCGGFRAQVNQNVNTTATPSWAGGTFTGFTSMSSAGVFAEIQRWGILGGALNLGHVTSENTFFQFEPFGGFDMIFGNLTKSYMAMRDTGGVQFGALTTTQIGNITGGTEAEFGEQFISLNRNVTIVQNVTIGQVLKLTPITLPPCTTSTNGSIAMNNSGIYRCFNTWNII